VRRILGVLGSTKKFGLAAGEEACTAALELAAVGAGAKSAFEKASNPFPIPRTRGGRAASCPTLTRPRVETP
jgi:hypothetical protein